MNEILDVVASFLHELSLLKLALVCFAILLFFLFREFFAWYWKMNEVTELLRKIEENTRK
ncbi:MAG: hypothetical protein RLZZ76_536 [Candidatus Parcubacteria bacterium]|jgi:hypothetical protein